MYTEARKAALRERNNNELNNLNRIVGEETDPESGWAKLEQASGIDMDYMNGNGSTGLRSETQQVIDDHADIAMKLLMSRMPKGPLCLKDGTLLKLNHNFEWLPLRVAVSPDHVLFARNSENFVMDSIPLLDIVHIEDSLQDELIPGFVDHETTDSKFRDGKLYNSGAAWRNIRNHITSSAKFTTDLPCFELRTCDGGYNGGRSYYLKVDAIGASREDWIRVIRQAMKSAVARKLAEERWIRRQQATVLAFYQSDAIQGVVAILILANFITNVAQTEMQPPDDSESQRSFTALDNMFTGIFALELAINMFGNWLSKFITNPWSVFDFIVVGVSVFALIFEEAPGISVLRLMRAFRVLRLFGRLQSFRKIIKSLTIAIVPVSNAFVILFMVSAIYSIMGCTFFGSANAEQFGSFSLSFFTMFQTCTGDGWGSDIARPLFIFFQPDGAVDPVTAIFFSSYIILVGWTLLSVVVAVLLDNFIQASWSERDAAERARKKKKHGKSVAIGPLDPLLLKMSHFRSSDDLHKQIKLIFQAVDMQGTGALTYIAVRDGLRKLSFDYPLMLSADDYQLITNNGEFCNERGEMTYPGFEKMMLLQMKNYIQRRAMAQMESLNEDRGGTQLGAILFSLKMMVGIVDDILEKDPELQEIKGKAVQQEKELKLSVHRGLSSIRNAALRHERNMQISQNILARLRTLESSKDKPQDQVGLAQT